MSRPVLRWVPFEFSLRDDGLRTGALVLLVTLLAGSGRFVVAQDFPGAPNEPALNLRVYPLDTWSPRVGGGVGAGLVFHHLGRPNAQALLSGAPAVHEQVITGAWASANPREVQQYVLFSARGLHTNRDWFYGLGPGSQSTAQHAIERSAVRVRIRGGQAYLDHRLILQPELGLSAHRVDRIPPLRTSSLSPRSQNHLRQLASEARGLLDPKHALLHVGLSVRYDTRPSPSPTAGGVLLQGRWARSFDLTSSFLRFDRLDLGVYGVVPLWGRHRLVGRLHGTVTTARGRTPVPYYLRPRLGASLVPGWNRGRFVDSDRLVSSVLYWFPLVDLLGVISVEGHLGVHAANVYNDVFEEATLEASFEEQLPSDPATAPFRPSASMGLHLGLTFREMPSLDVALGLSPEGVTAARFTVKKDLWTLRPPHHQLFQGF